jgi:hypothetical protein
MTVTGPLITRRRLVLVGLETDRGTGVTPDVGLLPFEPKITPALDYLQSKPALGSGGAYAGEQGIRVGKFTCRAEVRGNGNSGSPALDPGIEVLLLCCGLQLDGGVLRPQSIVAEQKTCTVWCYEDGRLKKLIGCAGDASLEAEVGKPMMVTFDVSGIWQTPTDESLPAPSIGAVRPPRFAASVLTLTPNGGSPFTPRVNRFSLKLGNVVSPREDAAVAAGVLHYSVADRDPQITIDPEAVLVGEQPFYTQLEAGTLIAVSCAIGLVAGNQVTIAAPFAQHRQIADGDRGGKATDEITLQCTFDEGDDDITITPA